MRICSINDLKAGDVLGKSIYLSNFKLLLGAGYRINESIITKLREKGYSHVYIMEEGTEDVIPEDIISDELRFEAKKTYEDKISQLNKAYEFRDMSSSKVIESLKEGNLKHVEINYEMRTLINEIIEEISETGVKYMNSVMIKTKDSFFFDHALNTTVLTILIGKKFRFVKQEITSLAMGAFLHDIGKIIVEQMESGEKDKKNNALYKEHQTFGYLMLRNDNSISPLVLQTVNQHHEQQDGKGFPIGLSGDNIPPVKSDVPRKGKIFRFAEICSVAEGYDRRLLNPVNGEKSTPVDVIKDMVEKATTVYNKSIVEVLSQIIPVYPVGSFVKLINIADPKLIGCYGVVAKINENDLKRPTIIVTTNKYRKKIKPIIIDTSKLTRLEMKLLM